MLIIEMACLSIIDFFTDTIPSLNHCEKPNHLNLSSLNFDSIQLLVVVKYDDSIGDPCSTRLLISSSECGPT